MKVYVDYFTATFRFPKGTDPKKAAGCVAYNMRRLHKYLQEEGLYLAPTKSKIMCNDQATGLALQDKLQGKTKM